MLIFSKKLSRSIFSDPLAGVYSSPESVDLGYCIQGLEVKGVKRAMEFGQEQVKDLIDINEIDTQRIPLNILEDPMHFYLKSVLLQDTHRLFLFR